MNKTTRYRDFEISLSITPIPGGPNYCYSHRDFDGAPDSGDQRYGWANSLQEACDAIDEWWFDQTTQALN